MNFEETIATLQPLFERHNFKIVEKWEGLVLFQSDVVSARFAYDEREKAACFYAGKMGHENVIHEKNVKDVFNHVVVFEGQFKG